MKQPGSEHGFGGPAFGPRFTGFLVAISALFARYLLCLTDRGIRRLNAVQGLQCAHCDALGADPCADLRPNIVVASEGVTASGRWTAELSWHGNNSTPLDVLRLLP